MTSNIVSKTEAAAALGCHPSRLSHWIRDKKLTAPAVDGSGRGARINLTLARKQLKNTIDLGQRTGCGNASHLRLEVKPARVSGQVAQKLPTRPEPKFPRDVWGLMREIPNTVAAYIVYAGAPAKIAYAVDRSLRGDLRQDVKAYFGEPPAELFDPVDWEAVAKEAGEPVDLAAWERWAVEEERRRFGDD